MSKSSITKPSFDIFNLVTDDIEKLEIKENFHKDKCLVKDKTDDNKYYSAFILDENQRTRIICDVTFYPSSITNKYIPRLAFKKVDLENNDKTIELLKPINIAFTKSAFSIQYNDKDYETEQRLKALIKLHGVQVPVASAILTLCYPEEYCVIDRRGWRQIFYNDKKKTYYTLKEYINYMTIIKRTALEFGVTPQEIDMAIWQHDIEMNRKRN